MYYVGRFITGMSGGAFSIVAPVYTAEIGEKHIRGALGTYYEFMLAVGVEFSYVVGGLVSVFWLCIICACVPIVFAIMFFFMPESPYYLIQKVRNFRKWEFSLGSNTAILLQNKSNKAEKALKWLRGDKYDVTLELKEITESIQQHQNTKLSLEDFKTKAAVKSIVIAFWLMAFQQFGGANAVVFNTTSIFHVSSK